MRLGVFAGDFSLDAVEAVTARAPWATDLLEILLELVDGSLLRQHDDAGVPLYSMLVPVREIASGALRARAECEVPFAARTASTTCGWPPRSSRSCRAPRSPPRWRGSKPNATTCAPRTAT